GRTDTRRAPEAGRTLRARRRVGRRPRQHHPAPHDPELVSLRRVRWRRPRRGAPTAGGAAGAGGAPRRRGRVRRLGRPARDSVAHRGAASALPLRALRGRAGVPDLGALRMPVFDVQPIAWVKNARAEPLDDDWDAIVSDVELADGV